MSLVVITPPADMPVSLAQARSHLRADGDDEDIYITSLIGVATARVDGPTGSLGRAIMRQTLELRLSSFYPYEIGTNEFVGRIRFDGLWIGIPPYCGFDLPCRPISSIVSITYTDTDGNDQVLDPSVYMLDGSRLMLAYGQQWPDARWWPNSVRIRYVAGYDDAPSVPAPIKQAILLMVGHLFQNREAVTDGRVNQPFELPQSYEALLAPYRVYE